MIEYIIGDITETDCEYIAHGVNCQNAMGSGVAFPKIGCGLAGGDWGIVERILLDNATFKVKVYIL